MKLRWVAVLGVGLLAAQAIAQDTADFKTQKDKVSYGIWVTVESAAYCLASHRSARFRLTYELRPLPEGLQSWFLVSMERLQIVP